MTKDEIISELDRRANGYQKAGTVHEWAFWLGAGVSAACSAIAGLSVAANISSWNEPYGRIVSATFAIIPAVWLAVDSAVRFRQLSVFNYGVSLKLKILSLKMKGHDLDDDTKKYLDIYEAILKDEHEKFSELLAEAPGARKSGQSDKVAAEFKSAVIAPGG